MVLLYYGILKRNEKSSGSGGGIGIDSSDADADADDEDIDWESDRRNRVVYSTVLVTGDLLE